MTRRIEKTDVRAQLNQFVDLTSSRSLRRRRWRKKRISFLLLVVQSKHVVLVPYGSMFGHSLVAWLSFDNVFQSKCALIGFDLQRFFTYRLREYLSVCLEGTRRSLSFDIKRIPTAFLILSLSMISLLLHSSGLPFDDNYQVCKYAFERKHWSSNGWEFRGEKNKDDSLHHLVSRRVLISHD